MRSSKVQVLVLREIASIVDHRPVNSQVVKYFFGDKSEEIKKWKMQVLLLVKTEASVSDWALLGVELKSPEKQLLGIGQLMDHFSVLWFPIPIFCLSSLVKFSPFRRSKYCPSWVS